eukprot:443788-Prorocentrum_lima.AAC.1
MYVANVMRHNSTGRLWSQLAFRELVGVTTAGPKKVLEARGRVGYLPSVLAFMDQQGHLCVGKGPLKEDR